MTRRSSVGSISIGLVLLSTCTPPAARAGSYDALCGGVKCVLTVSPESISTPYGSIVPSRVTYWGSTGDSSTSVGTGVATTILFGGIGLLGFLAKNHEYSFTINGYNAEGKRFLLKLLLRMISRLSV